MSDIDGDPIAALGALAKPLPRGGVVLDVGAFHGIVTNAMRPYFPDADFYLFEPLPQRFRALQHMLGDTINTRLVNKALSAKNGVARFHVGEFEPVSSLFPRNTAGKKYFNPAATMAKTIEVETCRLDDFCVAQNIDHIACLKLDTQGAEHSILTGARGLLDRQAIDIIYTEWFAAPHYEDAPLLDAIWALLTRHGYRLYDLFKGPYGDDGQLRYGEAIFLSAQYCKTCLPHVTPASHAVARYG